MPIFGEGGIITSRKTKVLADARKDKATNDAEILALTEKRDALLDQAADVEGGACLTPEIEAELSVIETRRERLMLLAPRLDRKLADAEAAEFARVNAKEIAARTEANKTLRRSAGQHVAEIKRQLAPVPDLLGQFHERVTLAEEADERASKITGAPVLGNTILARLLGHAVKAAGLEELLETALRLTANDKTEVRPLATELDELLDLAMEAFDYRLDLRQPAPPSAEEIAAREEAERQEVERQRRAAEHTHRVQNDPQYRASMFPVPGSKPKPVPGSEAGEAVRRRGEDQTNEALRHSGPSRDSIEQANRLQRQGHR